MHTTDAIAPTAPGLTPYASFTENLGISSELVNKLLLRGMPGSREEGIPQSEAWIWILRQRETPAAMKARQKLLEMLQLVDATEADAEALDRRKALAATEKAEAQSETAKIQTQKLKGSLVDKAEYEQGSRDWIEKLKQQLLEVASRVAPELATTPGIAECRGIVDRHIRAAMRNGQ